jgi:hypothetical protein
VDIIDRATIVSSVLQKRNVNAGAIVGHIKAEMRKLWVGSGMAKTIKEIVTDDS